MGEIIRIIIVIQVLRRFFPGMVEEDTMQDSPEVRKIVADLCTTQRSAVLATHHQGQPYCSLMAFAASDDLTAIYLATFRATRKYANMAADPRVALLMDNRANQPGDTHEALAVTVMGRAAEVAPTDRHRVLPMFLAKHPHMADFAASPDCTVIRVTVARYSVVSSFQEIRELPMTAQWQSATVCE